MSATSLPARELAGQVWIFTGTTAGSEPVVHDTFLRNDVRICGLSLEMETHWTRVMENMLDWPHLPFVHQRTIGKGLVASADRGRMNIEMIEQPWGFSSRISIDGVEQPASLDYRFPNVMNLFIPIPKKTLVLQVACVPISEARTRLVLVTARDFAKLRVLDGWFNRQNAKIANEDRAIIESSSPARVPPARDERSVRTDAPTLYFRKRFFAELQHSKSLWPEASEAEHAAPSTHEP